MNGCAMTNDRVNRLGVQKRGQLVANVLRLADMIRHRYRPGRTHLNQIALLIMTETECCKATAYRWAGEFVDALGLELAPESAAKREWSRRGKKSPGRAA